MADVFVSYARSTAKQAQAVAGALRALGYSVWLDDALPTHRAYARVIEEELDAAKAVIVIWHPDAARSDWVSSEASRARRAGKLVQLRVEKTPLPMPFDQIQCADLSDWDGNADHPAWAKVVASVAELVEGKVEDAARPAIAGARPVTEPTPAFPAPLPLPSKPSIAVMPFANLSNDPDQAYFADGIMDEIVTGLTRFKSIFVIASSSTMTFKGRSVSPPAVARELGVRYLLEGSVRKSADRVRVAIKLINAADGSQIWNERYDDTLADVFALQDRIAATVVGVIEPAIEAAEIRRAAHRPTENMDSYDLFLRGWSNLRKYDQAETMKSLDLLERAIALDPHFGAALTAAATCHLDYVIYGWGNDPVDHAVRAVELTERALKISGDDGFILAWSAVVQHVLARNFELARSLAERAIAANPGSADVWYCSGLIHMWNGELDLAIARCEATIRMAPNSWLATLGRLYIGFMRFLQGRPEEALPLIGQDTASDPVRYACLAAVLGHLGRTEEAQAALQRCRSLSALPTPAYTTVFLREEHRELFLEGLAQAEGTAQFRAAT